RAGRPGRAAPDPSRADIRFAAAARRRIGSAGRHQGKRTMRQLLLPVLLASLLAPAAAAQTAPARPEVDAAAARLRDEVVALRRPAPLAALLAPAAPAQTAPARPGVDAAAARLRDEVVALRRHFHQFPELSNREEETAAKVAGHLRSLGLEPRTGVAHHGVV